MRSEDIVRLYRQMKDMPVAPRKWRFAPHMILAMRSGAVPVYQDDKGFYLLYAYAGDETASCQPGDTERIDIILE